MKQDSFIITLKAYQEEKLILRRIFLLQPKAAAAPIKGSGEGVLTVSDSKDRLAVKYDFLTEGSEVSGAFNARSSLRLVNG